MSDGENQRTVEAFGRLLEFRRPDGRKNAETEPPNDDARVRAALLEMVVERLRHTVEVIDAYVQLTDAMSRRPGGSNIVVNGAPLAAFNANIQRDVIEHRALCSFITGAVAVIRDQTTTVEEGEAQVQELAKVFFAAVERR